MSVDREWYGRDWGSDVLSMLRIDVAGGRFGAVPAVPNGYGETVPPLLPVDPNNDEAGEYIDIDDGL